MGLYIRQDDNRSELQRRISAELTEKARKKAELDNQPLPDGVDDSAYVKDTQRTSRFAWVWILLFIGAVVATLIFILN